MESKQMQEMTRATVRDSAGVFFFSFSSDSTANPFYSPLFSCMSFDLDLDLRLSLIFPDVDETNCIPDNGVSTSFLRCSTLVVISKSLLNI